jgi:hypothetical protein
MPTLKMPRRTLALTEEERQELIGIAQRDPRAYMREKAHALLAIARGYSPHFVATSGLSPLRKSRHPETLYIWLDAYLTNRKLLPQPARRAFSPKRPRTPGDTGAGASDA